MVMPHEKPGSDAATSESISARVPPTGDIATGRKFGAKYREACSNACVVVADHRIILTSHFVTNRHLPYRSARNSSFTFDCISRT
jgi:hypothetical protein